MNFLKSSILLIAITCLVTLDAHSQSDESSLNYSLQFDRGSYDTMQQRAGERGISASDFGQWLADNGQASIVVNDSNARLPQQHRLTLFLVDQNGSVRQSQSATFSYRGSGGERVQLSRLVSARELGGLLARLFPDSTFFPGSDWFPDTTFFPDSTFISSTRELQQMAGNSGRQALSRSENVGERGFALFITLTPDADRFEQDVSPGGTGFVGSF